MEEEGAVVLPAVLFPPEPAVVTAARVTVLRPAGPDVSGTVDGAEDTVCPVETDETDTEEDAQTLSAETGGASRAQPLNTAQLNRHPTPFRNAWILIGFPPLG